MGVVNARAHHGAGAGFFDKQPQQDRNAQAEAQQGQPIERKYAAENLHGAIQQIRLVEAEHLAAPDGFREVGEDEGEAEGQQHLIELAARIGRAQEEHLDHDGHQRHGQGRQKQRPPEAAGELDGAEPAEGAQHKEGAMGEVHHAHEAEDQRQS